MLFFSYIFSFSFNVVVLFSFYYMDICILATMDVSSDFERGRGLKAQFLLKLCMKLTKFSNKKGFWDPALATKVFILISCGYFVSFSYAFVLMSVKQFTDVNCFSTCHIPHPKKLIFCFNFVIG